MRLSRPFVCVILFVTGLLAAAPGLAAGLFGTPGGEPDVLPHRFIRFDAADVGCAAFPGQFSYPLIGGEFLKVTCQLERLRFGVACSEFWGDIVDGPLGPLPVPMTIPVYLGCDIWHNPVKSSFFYGAVPDIYAETGVSFFPLVVIKAAVACDVDCYGFGLRAEAGYYVMPSDNSGLPYVSVQLRLLTFGIGF